MCDFPHEYGSEGDLISHDFEGLLDLNATEGKIIEGAYACFNEIGVRKTTMADIAAKADVSRATVYKYFSKKNDILKRICHLEMIKVNQVVRSQIKDDLTFAEKLTEALAISVQLSRENFYIDRIFRHDDFWETYHDRNSNLYEWHSEQWAGFLSRARKNGDLSSDIDDQMVTRWLSYCQQILMFTMEDLAQSADGMRHFIRRFMVTPILGRTPPAPTDHTDTQNRSKDDENATLRAIVLDQALEIFNLKNGKCRAPTAD